MTGIMIGFTRAVHRLGTVYGNYSLDSQATGINAAGPNGDGSGNSTITFPASPSTGQTITVNNIGTGTITITGLTITPGYYPGAEISPNSQLVLTWGGTSWTIVSSLGTINYTSPSFATWGTVSGDFVLSNGNLTATTGGGAGIVYSNISRLSEKWYCELNVDTADIIIGFGLKSDVQDDNLTVSFSEGSLAGMAFDAVTGAIDWYLDGVLTYQVLSWASVGESAHAAQVILFSNGSAANVTINFGATPFIYSVPAGYNSGFY